MPDDLARATVRIDPDLSYFKESLRSKLATETEGVSADVAVKASLEGFARTDAEVQALGGDVTYKVKPELDLASVAEVKAEEEGLNRELEHSNEALKHSSELMADVKEKATALGDTIGGNLTPALAGAGEAAGGASQGMGALLTGALTLGPALIPVAAGVTAAFGALIPVTIAAGAGVAAFALAAASQLGPLTSEFKDLLSTFQRLAAPDVIPVVHSAMALLPDLFSTMLPVVHSVSGELTHLLEAGQSAFQAPFWERFITLIQSQAGPALGAFMTLIGGVGKALAGVSEAFAPFITSTESAISRIGNAMASWGQNLGASSGFQSFMNYVRTEGPQVLTVLDNLWHILIHVVEALAPIGAVVIGILGPLTSFANLLLGLNPILTDVVTGLVIAGFAWKALSSPLLSAADALVKFATGMTVAKDAQGGIGGLTAAFSALKGSLSGIKDAFQVGSEATSFGEATAGAASGATSLAAGIGFVTAAFGGLLPALAVAGGLAAGVALDWKVMGDASRNNSDAVKEWTGTVIGLTSDSLPGLHSALETTKNKLDSLRGPLGDTKAQFDQLVGSNARLQTATGWFADLPGFLRGSVLPFNALNESFNQLNNQFHVLSGQYKTASQDIGFLSEHFGVTRQEAEKLSQTLGFDLKKNLSAADILQFSSALQNMAAQSGLTESALLHLSQISHTAMSTISTDIQHAVTATQNSWKSYGDAITAFQGTQNITADKVREFYALNTLQAQNFVSNIQKLVQEGYDPRFISQAIQAGPAQAANLVQALATQSTSGVQRIMKQGLDAMNAAQAQAVEQSRLTAEAVASKTSTFAADLSKAMSVSQALTLPNVGARVNQLLTEFSGNLPAIQRVATEYGIALPKAIQDRIALAELYAASQAQAANTGFNSGKAGAGKAGADQAGAHNAGLSSGKPGATKAGTEHAGAFNTATATGRAQALIAGNLLGHNAATGMGHHTDESAKSGTAHHTAFTTAISKGDVTKAADLLVTAFATALGKNTKSTEKAGEDLGKALVKGISTFKDDLGKSGDDLGTALTKSIASYDDDMQRAGADLARNLALGMTSQSGAVDAARTTATQIVNTIEQVVRAGVPVVQSDANRIGQAIATAITQHTGDTHAAIAAMVTDFVQVIDSGVSRSQNEGTKLTQAIVTGINSVNLSDAARTLVSQFVSGLSNTSGAYNAGRGLANAAAQGAASVGSGTFQQIGLSFTQGITAGINNSAAQAQLQQAAANAAHTAVNAASGSGGLIAKSPSKKTHDELGVPFVQGFEEGITASLSSLVRTSAGAATAAVSGGRAGLTTSALTARLPGGVAASAPAAAGTTLNYTPTYHIQGGADPDTVRKFQAMLDAHDRDLVHTIQSLT